VKSSYFEGSSDETEEKQTSKVSRRKGGAKRARYADGESDQEKYKDESEEEAAPTQPKKRSRGRPPKKAREESEEEDDQYNDAPDDDDKDEDEDDEDEDEDEDGPRKVEIIPLEKLRDTGGVSYEDHKLHKNTMLFLKDLKANNKRPWLKCTLKCFRSTSRPCRHSLKLIPVMIASPRRRIQKSPQRLAVLCRSNYPNPHRSRRYHPRATRQGRHLSHPPRHSLQQRPNTIQGMYSLSITPRLILSLTRKPLLDPN
jgi:hypothetical protein